jgi:hypothetical protein
MYGTLALVKPEEIVRVEVEVAGTGLFLGDGIFKSLDNGLTWTQLATTVSGTPQTYDNAFDFVHNVAVSQTNGYVFAAASNTIQRSTNGGTSWTTVLGSFANNAFSDIQITSTGILYATISSGGVTNTGIWRSTNNGDSWTSITPVGYPTTYSRIVIGISPSSENLAYFLAETSPAGTLGHSLWQYNSTTTNWLNRSANIPAFGGAVGDFDSQGAYDLVIKIKPDDPNFVIVGGTNLYRSTNGFSTSATTAWIGGYSPINNVSIYTDQHPDQHAIEFLPGSNIIVYTGHDGGISKTTDITTTFGGSEPVDWISLNNSYYTTQFYSISLAPENGSNAMMGGLQDNGTWFGNSAGSSNWSFYESGDGTIVEVAPVADDRVYTAYQLGGVRRRTRAGGFLADFTPSGSTNKIFVNPVVLDPNNSSLYYYAAGNGGNAGVWRNSNVINATPTIGWSYLSTTSISFFVTAVAVSTSNNANVVYFGSNTGPIRRIDNANTGSTPIVTDIKGSLPNAYVSCIAIDPTNSNNALLTFSNYNIQSLWYTTNGGTSWTDVEGNLAGASGPSVRWANIFYVSGVPHYFLATSVGVYFTILLNGASTVWTQEAVNEIGNVVCTMLDWRNNDGTLAVATHGRGIFTTSITTPLPVELSLFTAKVLKSGGVQLSWQTKTEVSNYGFEVERAKANFEFRNSNFEKIGFVEGHGNSNSPKDYSFTDNNAGYGKYSYRLKQIDTDGQSEYSKVIEVDAGNIPDEFILEQNYPNPFNPSTTIKFAIAETQQAKLIIYDVLGNEVAIPFNGTAEGGKIYEVEFNVAQVSRPEITSGVYFYRLATDNRVENRKMLLLK